MTLGIGAVECVDAEICQKRVPAEYILQCAPALASRCIEQVSWVVT